MISKEEREPRFTQEGETAALPRAFAVDGKALGSDERTPTGYGTSLHAVAASWREGGIKPVGACFYHGQNLESAVAGKGLSLGFDAFGPANHDKSVRVGTTIIDVLRAHGVPTKWDGDPEESIWIEPFIWWRPTV